MNGDHLREQADRADSMAAGLGNERASHLLAVVADCLRGGAGVYESDPTLVGDAAHRDRPLDLLSELGRQIPHVVRSAVDGRRPERWPIADRWKEAEELTGRMPEILTEARAAAVDISVPSASEQVSALRLRANASYIENDTEAIRNRLRSALNLPHPHPAARRLAELTDEIERTLASVTSGDA